ncbi:MAG: hypothetical protein AB8B80_10365 [Marinicellaceae bacterium]
MKKILIIIGLISWQAQSADLIFKNGFENSGLVGGMVTGLSSSGLELNLSFNAVNYTEIIVENGGFLLNQYVPVGANWTVTVATQPNNPTPQSCTLTNASGAMTISGIDNVIVNCSEALNNWDVMHWDEGTWQ